MNNRYIESFDILDKMETRYLARMANSWPLKVYYGTRKWLVHSMVHSTKCVMSLNALDVRNDLMNGTQYGNQPFTTGSALIQKVITLTLSGTAASGFFRILYSASGQYPEITPWRAYNYAASGANNQTDIAALPSFYRYGQTVTLWNNGKWWNFIVNCNFTMFTTKFLTYIILYGLMG